MHIRRWLWVIFTIIIIVIATILWISAGKSSRSNVPSYSLDKVSRGKLISTVSATGTLSPVITVQVGSQVSGTILHLHADFNSHVKKGDLIAQIDPALFKARLAEAEANVKSAEAARDKAWIGVQDAKRQLERVKGLQKKNLVSDSDVDAAQFNYESTIAEHKVKQAAAAQAIAARDRERVNLDYTSIYAPINGVVISRDVDVGQTVAASLQAPTLFTIAQDLTHMQIETEVDEAFIGSIQTDQPVRFTVFAYQQRKFKGRVGQVRLNPKVEAGVVKYNCIIFVDNDDLALKPGMTATVTIEVARHEDILKVPNASLKFVPDLPADQLKKLSKDISANEGFIWTPGETGLKPVKVALGVIGDKETEISGDDISEGMPIAIPPKRSENGSKRRFGLSLF